MIHSHGTDLPPLPQLLTTVFFPRRDATRRHAGPGAYAPGIPRLRTGGIVDVDLTVEAQLMDAQLKPGLTADAKGGVIGGVPDFVSA